MTTPYSNCVVCDKPGGLVCDRIQCQSAILIVGGRPTPMFMPFPPEPSWSPATDALYRDRRAS